MGSGGAEGGNEWGRDGRRSGEVMVLDTEEKGRTGSKEVTGGQMRKAGLKKQERRQKRLQLWQSSGGRHWL